MKKSIPIFSGMLLIAMMFSSCETPGESAMAGAAAGAAIGGLAHGRGGDALHGAAIGAGAGYLIGKILEYDRRDRYYDDDRYYTGRSRYPFARPTNRYGFVTSPYSPYNLIDVRGIPRGAKVIDPSCDRVFFNP
jgi:hypothetical protein